MPDHYGYHERKLSLRPGYGRPNQDPEDTDANEFSEEDAAPNPRFNPRPGYRSRASLRNPYEMAPTRTMDVWGAEAENRWENRFGGYHQELGDLVRGDGIRASAAQRAATAGRVAAAAADRNRSRYGVSDMAGQKQALRLRDHFGALQEAQATSNAERIAEGMGDRLDESLLRIDQPLDAAWRSGLETLAVDEAAGSIASAQRKAANRKRNREFIGQIVRLFIGS